MCLFFLRTRKNSEPPRLYLRLQYHHIFLSLDENKREIKYSYTFAVYERLRVNVNPHWNHEKMTETFCHCMNKAHTIILGCSYVYRVYWMSRNINPLRSDEEITLNIMRTIQTRQQAYKHTPSLSLLRLIAKQRIAFIFNLLPVLSSHNNTLYDIYCTDTQAVSINSNVYTCSFILFRVWHKRRFGSHFFFTNNWNRRNVRYLKNYDIR